MKNYIYLGIGLLLLIMTGCTTNTSDEIITPTAVVENTKVPSPTVTKAPTNTPTPTPTLIPTPPLEEFSAKDFNAFNRKLGIDIELGSAGQSIFCIDETSGITYFVNQAKDYYLYQINDGNVELVVSMPVKEIYPYGGLVYFMVENYYDMYELDGIQDGDIYCYHPESGEVELIYPAGAIEGSKNHRLTVNESGIYFCYDIPKENGSISRPYYELPFGATEPMVDMRYTVSKGWNDYFFTYYNYQENLFLVSRDMNEDKTREEIELPGVSKIRYCVVGDKLYSAERTYISCIDLKTGEKTGYDFLGLIRQQQPKEILENGGCRIIEDFVVTENAVFVTSLSELYRMDLQSGEVTCATIVDKNNKLYTVQRLYTDGKEVYGSNLYSMDNKTMVHFLIDEITETDREGNYVGTPRIIVEPLVK